MTLALVKGVHIAALILWCAGLVALPLLLTTHRHGESQNEYARLRFLTHNSYTRLVTPAAVIAITAGTALIFLRLTFVPWMFAKLVAVGLLVALHALVGHTVILMSERRGEYVPPSAVPLLLVALATMVVVLTLVLAKPDIAGWLIPQWLETPLDRPLPVPDQLSEMPI